MTEALAPKSPGGWFPAWRSHERHQWHRILADLHSRRTWREVYGWHPVSEQPGMADALTACGVSSIDWRRWRLTASNDAIVVQTWNGRSFVVQGETVRRAVWDWHIDHVLKAVKP